MLKILFIGDIVGKIGRKAVAKILPKLRRDEKIDFVIANAENSAHGTGITEKTIAELSGCGIDFFTVGDHAFDKNSLDQVYNNHPLVRPANFSPKAPGNGYAIVEVKKHKILIASLIGRVFMKLDHECPFHKLDEILAQNNLSDKNISAIIIDIHAECSSEKISLMHYADGRATAILGTHTHIPTNDYMVTKKGLGYITDVGMVGAHDSCLGVGKEGIINTYLTQIKTVHTIPEKGTAVFNSVLLTIDPKTKKAKTIKPINKFVEIK